MFGPQFKLTTAKMARILWQAFLVKKGPRVAAVVAQLLGMHLSPKIGQNSVY
jgi:hypothetical protein